MEIGNFDLVMQERDFSQACECVDGEPGGYTVIIEISSRFIEKLPVLWQGWC